MFVVYVCCDAWPRCDCSGLPLQCCVPAHILVVDVCCGVPCDVGVCNVVCLLLLRCDAVCCYMIYEYALVVGVVDAACCVVVSTVLRLQCCFDLVVFRVCIVFDCAVAHLHDACWCVLGVRTMRCCYYTYVWCSCAMRRYVLDSCSDCVVVVHCYGS